jgi:hypothetical protein
MKRVAMNRSMIHAIANIPNLFRDVCEKRRLWGLAGFSLIYLLGTCAIASRKMLWNDELFTLYISRLGSLSDILAVLSTGADQTPPSFYLLTQGVLRLLGESHLAIRLPEMFGVLLMCYCLFRFVSKRSSALYGFAAMLFPLMTAAYEYAYEARPYGLVIGFAALALICWREATESPKRVWWLMGLAASGAAVTSSHYYAVFLLIPLGVGEIVRSVMRKRVDFPIWVSLGGIVAPLVLFFPIILEARRFTHHFWAHPEWYMIPGFYYTLLMPAIVPIVATLIASSLWPDGEPSRRQSSLSDSLLFPWHEIAAAIAFAALPILAVILGKLFIGAFTFRYVLSGVIGVSILWAITLQRVDAGRATAGTWFILFASIWFALAIGLQFKHQTSLATNWSNTYEFLQSKADPTLPIVVAELGSYMTLQYYAPPDISSRVVYLANPQAAFRYIGHDSLDQGMLDLRPWFPVSVEEYSAYISAHDRFLVYTRISGDATWLRGIWISLWDWIWLFNELPSAPVQIELMSRYGDGLLFLVTAHEHQ